MDDTKNTPPELVEEKTEEIDVLNLSLPKGYVIVLEKDLERLERLATQRTLKKVGITRRNKDQPKKKRKMQKKSRRINR